VLKEPLVPRWKRAWGAAALLGLILFPGRPLSAQDEFPKLTFGGLLEARGISTDTTATWLDGGLGKTRYGGVDGRRATLLRLSEASLLVTIATSEVLSASAQVNFDAQPDNRSERQHVDLVTAFVSYRPELTPHVRLRVRAGILIPPVSLENDGPAWTATRTTTPSAANSWIGEEVRATGVEATLAWKGDRDEFSAFGSGFGNNGGAGTLLAYRGWALHDRLSGFDDQLPLAALPSIQAGGPVPQAPWVQPFTEIGGRLGYYAGGDLRHSGRVHLTGIYYDNRGDGTTFDGFQYAWKTHFYDLGGSLNLPGGIELLGQHMRGRAQAGQYGGDVAVDAPFWTTYGLASVAFGRARVSARYDTFAVDSDGSLPESTRERGSAWTGALLVRVGDAHRLAFEVLRVSSDRPDRASVGGSRATGPTGRAWGFRPTRSSSRHRRASSSASRGPSRGFRAKTI
jgi:hypothetical protein